MGGAHVWNRRKDFHLVFCHRVILHNKWHKSSCYCCNVKEVKFLGWELFGRSERGSRQGGVTYWFVLSIFFIHCDSGSRATGRRVAYWINPNARNLQPAYMRLLSAHIHESVWHRNRWIWELREELLHWDQHGWWCSSGSLVRSLADCSPDQYPVSRTLSHV